MAPGAVLHVGDSPRDDYEGARGAGLRAVLLDRDDRHPHVAGTARQMGHVHTNGCAAAAAAAERSTAG